MDIPVTFEHEGKEIRGTLSGVTGSANEGGMWHLMVGNYYWGRLRLTAAGLWFYDENEPRVGHLVDYFAAVVLAWYQ